MFQKKIKSTLICFLLVCSSLLAPAQMTPQEAILKMTCGINVGRSLELANEGDAGGRYIQEYYFEDFKTAGFNFVRIPIQWDQHTGITSPYTVDAAWLNRVEQVIDWSLKHGLITIINSHHDKWILEDNSYTTTDLARFDSIWAQVSVRFKDKSDSLLFEIANEPNIGISLVDKINSHVIPIIRRTNPTRNIVFGSSGTQLSTLKKAVIPKDSFLIASFHTYEPWAFAGEGTGTWGTTTQINIVKAMMKDANAWQTANKIPLFLGEFGTIGKCDPTSRMKWFYTHLEEARRYNIAPAVWQDFGNFSVYFNTTTASNKWTTTVKDIIVYTHPLSAELLTITPKNIEDAQLTWKNRDENYRQIKIDRKLGSGSYSTIATLDGNATSFLDETTTIGKTYTYRVVAELPSGIITHSFPVEIKIVTPTSINEFKKGDNMGEISAFFNGDMLTIKTTVDQPYLNFTVFTLLGQGIISGRCDTNEHQLNAPEIPKGIYLLNIIANNGLTKTLKVVKR
jgi:aryl-phospho-beta-D-glucosidase BglC (GH1 family)